jgi:electron-transferring-flavoprotein dehydrogenase
MNFTVALTQVYDELKQVRNCHGAFEYGLLPGLAYSAASAFMLKGREPWTFHNKTPDYAKTKPAAECSKIEYPKADGVLSFDLLTNLTLSGTGHVDDQPSHLKLRPNKENLPSSVSMPKYAGPEQRFCPAGVYNYSDADEGGEQELQIGAQNCLHCKTCDIKMPEEYIEWNCPEGGGGPLYTSL